MKYNHSSLNVQPSRSSLLVWMPLCLMTALALTTLIPAPALAQKWLTAAEAKDHVGETATVCGTPRSSTWARPIWIKSSPWWIWGSKRSKFDNPVKLKGWLFCVTGKIIEDETTENRRIPEITADSPFQLAVYAVVEPLPPKVKRNPIEQN